MRVLPAALISSGVLVVALVTINACTGDDAELVESSPDASGPVTDGGGQDSLTSDAAAASDASMNDADADAGQCVLSGMGVIDLAYANGQKSLGQYFTTYTGALDSAGRLYLVGNEPCNPDAGLSVRDIAMYRLDPAGVKDSTFGLSDAGNRACYDLGANDDVARAAVIDGMDRLIVGTGQGAGGALARVVRFTTSGTLDTSYGTAGTVTLSGTMRIQAMVLDSNGKTVVAGDDSGIVGGRVYRRNSDGSPDSTFGSGGEIFVAGVRFFGVTTSLTSVTATGIDSQGNVAVYRWTAGGQPDGTFNGSGIATVALDGGSFTGSVGRAIGTRAGGAPVVLAAANAGAQNGPAQLVALTSGGTVDNTFAGGVVTLPQMLLDVSVIQDGILIQCDGKIIAAAQKPGFEPLITRYMPDGGVDTTFGAGGVLSPNLFNAYPLKLFPTDGGAIFLGTRTGGAPHVTRFAQ